MDIVLQLGGLSFIFVIGILMILFQILKWFERGYKHEYILMALLGVFLMWFSYNLIGSVSNTYTSNIHKDDKIDTILCKRVIYYDNKIPFDTIYHEIKK